jgi:type I restriction enzyme M protein
VGLGKVVINEFDVCISQDSQGLILDEERVVPEFLLYVLAEKVLVFKDTSQGTTIQGVTKNTLRILLIPLPPLATQQAIVAEIEAEQALVAANRELIVRFEKKIQATLARVWSEDEPAPAEA